MVPVEVERSENVKGYESVLFILCDVCDGYNPRHVAT